MYLSDIILNDSILHFATTFNDIDKIEEKINFGKTITNFKKSNKLDYIGFLYFENAIKDLIKLNYKSAYIGFIKGFSFVTCDCRVSVKIKEYYLEIKNSYNVEKVNCSIDELHFILAIYFYYLNSVDFGKFNRNTSSQSLAHIDYYLNIHPNSEIGHYIKGRILSEFKIEEALKEFEFALKIDNNQRVNYRIGKLYENKLDKYGLNYLYQSILMNPLSNCAIRSFKIVCDKRNIKLKTNTDKFLANIFNNSNSDDFFTKIIEFKKEGIIKLNSLETICITQAYSDFVDGLKEDENLFMVYNYEEFEEDDDSNNYNDDRPRYSKYGGANGLDDRTINDAFDGDADNYWNVD